MIPTFQLLHLSHTFLLIRRHISPVAWSSSSPGPAARTDICGFMERSSNRRWRSISSLEREISSSYAAMVLPNTRKMSSAAAESRWLISSRSISILDILRRNVNEIGELCGLRTVELACLPATLPGSAVCASAVSFQSLTGAARPLLDRMTNNVSETPQLPFDFWRFSGLKEEKINTTLLNTTTSKSAGLQLFFYVLPLKIDCVFILYTDIVHCVQ